MGERQMKVHRIWRVGEHWCIVGDNGLAFYVGYVFLPEGHPWYGKGYDDIDADVHGGLTFSGRRDWEGWITDDGAPEGYYIGFDCGHSGDAPIPGSPMDTVTYRDILGDHHWTVDEVAEEVNRLAVQVQLAAVMSTA